MITFPLADGASLVVVEPGNIARLKQGRPLKINDKILLCFTPDAQRFLERNGAKAEMPESGARVECQIHLTAEQLDAALKACQNLPEVKR